MKHKMFKTSTYLWSLFSKTFSLCIQCHQVQMCIAANNIDMYILQTFWYQILQLWIDQEKYWNKSFPEHKNIKNKGKVLNLYTVVLCWSGAVFHGLCSLVPIKGDTQ